MTTDTSGNWLVTLLVLLCFGPAAIAAAPTPVAPGRASTSSSAERVSSEATPGAGGYARPDLLVEAGWLAANLDDPNLKVVALTPPDEFDAGHIPGAVVIDWPALEVTDTTDPAIERWQGAVETRLTELGVRPEQTVVVYDGGTLYAPRLWWILTQLGHRDVRVLGGGLAAWREAGGEVTTAGTWVGYAPANPYRGRPDPSWLAQRPEVEAALGNPGVVLVDARSPEEYAAGHIPDAVNIDFVRNARPDEPRFWKPAAELRAMYEAAGVTPDKRVITYCSTGVRAATAAFTLELLGYDVAVYTGSWAEWSRYPELPTATGSTP